MRNGESHYHDSHYHVPCAMLRTFFRRSLNM
jgi:hypothetical protein